MLVEQPTIANELLTVKYGEKLPVGYEDHFCSFPSGPNGETNPALIEYEARKKAKEEYRRKTPNFPLGKIEFVSKSNIADAPDMAVYTYRIKGLEPTTDNRTICLAFEKTPPSLAFPKSTNVEHADGIANFNALLLKNSSYQTSLPERVTFSNGQTHFEKQVPVGIDSIEISIISTSKPSDYVIGVQALMAGYQPIKAELPGPNIE